MSGTEIAYVSLAQTMAHMGMLLAAFLGFVGLALVRERHASQLMGKALPSSWRPATRWVGWALLAVALAVGIAYTGADTGITIWLGWLSVAGLALVFGMSAWSRKPARNERTTIPVNATSGPQKSAIILRGIGVAGLIATAAVFVYALIYAEPQILLQ